MGTPGRFRVMDARRLSKYGDTAMPVTSVPWPMVEPLRVRCFRFHDQTLETLNARGGLSPQELWIHVQDLKFAPETWSKMPTLDELRTWLRSLGGE